MFLSIHPKFLWVFLSIHLKIFIHISIYQSRNFYPCFYLSIQKFLCDTRFYLWKKKFSSIFLSIHLKIFICVSMYPSKNLHPHFYLSIQKFLWVFLSIHLQIFIHIFIYPSRNFHLFIHPSNIPTTYSSVYPCFYLCT